MALEFQSGENQRIKDRKAKADAAPGPDQATKARHEELLSEARERFALVVTAERAQRDQELEDLRFARARREDQWDASILANRIGSLADNIPARPCLVINKLGQPVQQVINEAKNSKLSIRIKAKANGATAEGAHLRQGLIRSIETNSQANIARFWALERAAKCGRGYYRVLKEYANDGDWDQDITVKLIQNQASVYLDPYHKELSGSDAEWAFITDDITRGEYRRRFAKSELAKTLANHDEVGTGADFLESVGDQPAPWVTDKNVRIAEYFYKTYKKRTRLGMPSPTGVGYELAWDDELDEDTLAMWTANTATRKRVLDVPVIHWCVINGYEVLDEEDWDGRFIPIVQVLGKVDNVNGERSYKGVITDAKDSQRAFNMQSSALVEAVALAPKAPWVVAEGQIEGYEEEWANANTRNYATLTYRPTALNGELVGAPQRNVAEPAIQAIALTVGSAEQNIKDTTGRQDASLGKYRSDESGRAIRERKEQGQQSSSNYMDFLATIAMPHEARILLDLLPKVYDTPGRVIRLLGDDPKKEEQAILGVPFVPGPGGAPVPVPEPQPGMPMQAPGPGMQQPPPPGAMVGPGAPPMGPPPPAPPKPKLYTLDDTGEYAVVVSVSPNVETEKEDNARAVETIMEALGPQAAAAVADIYAEQIEGPMGERLAKRLAKMNPLAAQDDMADEDVPPAAAAKIHALEQQMQQAMQAMQGMQQQIEMDVAKAEGDKAIAEANNATRERIAQLNAQVQMALSSGKAVSAEDLAKMKIEADMTMQSLDFAHDRMMAALNQRHAMAAQDAQAGHATMQNAQNAQLKLATTPAKEPKR